jgi:hypothetical protein
MKLLFSIFMTFVLMALTFTVPAMADAPAGAASANCDITQFTPIMSADGTTILYWNNPTCKNPSPIAECERDNSCSNS